VFDRLYLAGLWFRKAPSPVPEALRRKINISQLTARCRITMIMCVAGSIIDYTYFFSFKADRRTWPLLFGAAMVPLTYVLLARACQNWLAMPDQNARYVQSMRRIICLQVALGISWSVLMISVIRVADEDQRRMVYALAIALISTSMVSGPARYSFSFWVPITLGAFITIWADPGHFYMPILIALICYTILSAYSIVSMNRKLFEREKSLFEIERHSETIELLLQDFQDGSGSFLWETCPAQMITEFSGSHEAFAAARVNPLGMPFTRFIEALAVTGRGSQAETDPAVSIIARHFKDEAAFKEIILKQETAGQTLWWAVSGKPLFDQAGRLTGFRGLWSDVTDREEYKNALKFAADRDYLTKLYNRSAFNDILLSTCQSATNTNASLLCVDLDHFKRVNDNFGHSIGDNLLIAVSKRLHLCIRSEDHVFRLGGDEFAILLSSGGRAQAAGVARRIIEQISRPFVISGVRLQIGASIGIALLSAADADPDTWHRHADTALYRSKVNGKCTYSFFGDGAEDPFSMRRNIALEMHESVPLDQLFLVFQPIVDLETRRIVAAEALLRWRHPVFGVVLPQDFVPILEKGGQIARVGAFVIEQATRVAARLRPDIIVSINISPLQLADIDLPRKILAALDAAGLASSRIELEITESSLLEKDLQKLEVLRQIRTLGCGIALDDFGTGYASLLLLEQFPFSKIKIDGSFVREPGDDARRHLILNSIIKLANDLGICVAAEGIETAKQAQTVHELGCLLGQGFYFFPGLQEEAFLATAAAEGFATEAAADGAPAPPVAAAAASGV
jgi:diguanylate cyclase (GGDEF)-like protein